MKLNIRYNNVQRLLAPYII